MVKQMCWNIEMDIHTDKDLDRQEIIQALNLALSSIGVDGSEATIGVYGRESDDE